jgi:uncharacterized membrane protein
MMSVLGFAAALGCGLVAGAFFAFSTFVMKALARLPAPQGIAAMQSINVAVITPSFMTALVGPGLLCLALVVSSLRALDGPPAYYRLAGGALYLLGTLAVTIAFNVPRNDVLAKVAPDSPEGARIWETYLKEWTWWNHVRTAAAAVAAALFTASV